MLLSVSDDEASRCLVPAGRWSINSSYSDVSMSAGTIRSGGSKNWVRLGGELFVHRLDHLIEIEGFFKHAACAE